MENIVLTIGGLFKSFNLSDLFFWGATLILLLLLLYIVYLIRNEEEEKNIMVKPYNPNKKNNDIKERKEDSIKSIVNNIETNYDPKPIDLSKYEQEMENTAIISYDELVKKSSNTITYEDEYESGLDDVVVKKVDSTNMSNTQELVDLPKAVLMSYDSEEAFLKALTVLQKNLVR